MENNNLNDLTLIGNLVFCDETTFDNQNGNQFLEAIPRTFITKYAILDETLQHIKTFYMFMEDYCYNVVNPAGKGHKLYITKSKDSDQMLSVYSTNYNEIMPTQNITLRKSR